MKSLSIIYACVYTLCPNNDHHYKRDSQICCCVVVDYRIIVSTRWRWMTFWMCMPLSNIYSRMIRSLIVLFYKSVSFDCIPFTTAS